MCNVKQIKPLVRGNPNFNKEHKKVIKGIKKSGRKINLTIK